MAKDDYHVIVYKILAYLYMQRRKERILIRSILCTTGRYSR